MGKILICMDKWMYVGLSFVRRWFRKEVCAYVGVLWVNCCIWWSVWHWMLSSGNMMLEGIMFYCVRFTPFYVMVRCVRSKASVHPRISDDVVIHVKVKGVYFILYAADARRTGLCFVIFAKTDLSLLWCTITKFHHDKSPIFRNMSECWIRNVL